MLLLSIKAHKTILAIQYHAEGISEPVLYRVFFPTSLLKAQPVSV